MKFSDLFRRRTDRDRFAELVMRRAKERGWPHKVAYDRDDFRIDMDSNGTKMFLETMFKDWSTAGSAEAQAAEVERIVAGLLEQVDRADLEAALPLLLPTIRNRRELELYDSVPSTDAVPGRWRGAYRPLCDVLAIGLAIDRPNSIARVDASYLSEWGVPFDELLG